MRGVDQAGLKNEASAALAPAARFTLPLILALHVALVLGYSLATPVGEGPDEPEHLAFVQHLRATGRLPIAPARSGEGLMQAKHPPLYYGAAALVSLPWNLERLGFRRNPFFSFILDLSLIHI